MGIDLEVEVLSPPISISRFSPGLACSLRFALFLTQTVCMIAMGLVITVASWT
jgi:hypothetical protein